MWTNNCDEDGPSLRVSVIDGGRRRTAKANSSSDSLSAKQIMQLIDFIEFRFAIWSLEATRITRTFVLPFFSSG